MEKIIEKLFDINKIPAKLIFAVFLISGLILFTPPEFLKKLNLDEFLKDYGKYIGISFIVSFVFTVIIIYGYIRDVVIRLKNIKKRKKRISINIYNLDNYEKAVLREFFICQKNTLSLPVFNDTVVGLKNNGILYIASSTTITNVNEPEFPYSISDFAKSILLKDQKILGLDVMTNEEIMDNRPPWNSRLYTL